MNAYELADEFKNRNWDEVDCVLWCEKSANMLCQLADEKMELTGKFVRLADENNRLKDKISELEKKLQESAMNCISAYAQADDHYARVKELEKQSEPVAWTDGEDCVMHQYKECYPKKLMQEYTIPLYTTPQTKPLSDEELLQAIGRAWCSPENSYKELDSVLCLAMVKEIKLAIKAKVRNK